MAVFDRRGKDSAADQLLTGAVRKVALVGNPNVGKSVLFNVLTGAYVTVSNYPGTSVEVSRGTAVIDGVRCEIIDTPGMYGLLPITEEERVGRELLLEERPDLVLHVVDARNLERMLVMTLQLMDAKLPVILVVNIMDEAERLGLTIDLPQLAKRLGIPVIGAATAKRRGVEEIRRAISSAHTGTPVNLPYSRRLEADIAAVAELLHEEFPLARKSIALLLLQRDEEVAAMVAKAEGERYGAIAERVKEISFARRDSFHLDLSLERKGIVKSLLEGVFILPDQRRVTLNERISGLAVRPLTGVPLLLLTLYFGLYKFVGGFGAGTLVDLLEGEVFEGLFNPWIIGLVKAGVPWELVQELLVGEYGIITLGFRYAVGIILPIVATFFLFFSLLEDSGYFPRLALLVDRIFKKIGLTGRAVIPMVLGFGCSTMATMVTRTLETRRERIIAIVLMALAIPCSAQLGVIMALLSKFPGALLVWGCCLLVLFLLVGVLSSRLMPGETPMFYMELPPMRLPQLSNVVTKTYSRMQWYFIEILPLFVLASVLLWLGKITDFFTTLERWANPAMTALGLPAGMAKVFILGFFRRDYGAAGLYDLQSQGILTARQLTVAAVTLTLFVPCVAQFLMMKKEQGLPVALGIGLFVSTVAFSCGYLLNHLLLMTNWI
jgi:ferrous iron transport protein B